MPVETRASGTPYQGPFMTGMWGSLGISSSRVPSGLAAWAFRRTEPRSSGERGMIGRARHWRWILNRLLVLAAAGGLVWWRLEMVGRAVRLGRPWRKSSTTCKSVDMRPPLRQLATLLARRPDWDEAAYLLGLCEKTRGRPDAADAAWARVRPGSAFIAQAVLGRADLLAQLGRQADAEQLVLQALAEPGIDGSSLRWFLVPLYWQEGRVEEAGACSRPTGTTWTDGR